MPVFALVDCNNFYASCEKLFRPDLKDTPVVVLSNNDGCVVARSREAKSLGIKMGVPVFQIKAEMQRHGILAFSSNYAVRRFEQSSDAHFGRDGTTSRGLLH